MCGRFVRKGEPKKVAEALGVQDGAENWTESYNVAPGSTVPIVRDDPTGRHMIPAVWGFTSSGRGPLFNARAETVDSLPSFRDHLRLNRCLVPASGFYEWRPSDRQPFYFERVDGLPLAFAGIWKRVGDHLEATVITTTPNRDMSAIHDRMPVILSSDRWNNWLNPDPLSSAESQSLLCPSPDGTLTRWPVSRAVGSVRNDHQGLIERVEPQPTAQELFPMSS
jgi:putative SOS response-associated peptidase YedK